MSYSKSHVILIAFAIDTPDSLENVTVKVCPVSPPLLPFHSFLSLSSFWFFFRFFFSVLCSFVFFLFVFLVFFGLVRAVT